MQDLLIVGGGINGAGIARDAAGRGLSVTLVEQGDPGGATSWASSKLLHGGLRYLEQYAFRFGCRGTSGAQRFAAYSAPSHPPDDLCAAAYPGAAPGLDAASGLGVLRLVGQW
ncbi:MAG: FAD-dependent oxidoreductase [Betaproteobacteria bacterium]|nr:FAD-dependent oxidoreductase [Betaproteobacteria bacterium]